MKEVLIYDHRQLTDDELKGIDVNVRVVSSWQEVYNNSPRQIYRGFKDFSEEFVANILGGEVCLWTESAGGLSVEGKIWPRTAGLGERLWSDPTTGNTAISKVNKNEK